MSWELLHKKSLTHSHFISLSHPDVYFTISRIFTLKIHSWVNLCDILGHVRVSGLPWILRGRIYFNKFAFPMQNMGVIFVERSKVDEIRCVQERYAKFAPEFSLGAVIIVAWYGVTTYVLPNWLTQQVIQWVRTNHEFDFINMSWN